MEKSNEVVDYYPTISAQEIKPTSKETNNQTNEKKTMESTKLNRFMWEKELFNQKEKEKSKIKNTKKPRKTKNKITKTINK